MTIQGDGVLDDGSDDFTAAEELYKEENYEDALNLYQIAANKGNIESLNAIGNLYKEGFGVEEDYAKAVGWYKKAANRGDKNAMYRHVSHIRKDYAVAIKWYRKAASKENADAMDMIGSLYWLGLGFPQDKSQAFDWYKKAAELGKPISCFKVANMCRDVDGTEKKPSGRH